MRKFLVILFFIPFFSFAQQYSEVIEIPGKTSTQLYNSTREWFALTFNSSNDVIQLADSIQKKIIGKGIKQIKWPIHAGGLIGNILLEANVYFSISTQFKDGRFKYEIESTDIKTISGSSYTYSDLQLMATEEGLKAYFDKMKIRWSLSKKVLQQTLESNRLQIIECNNCLTSLISDLSVALKKDNNTNW